MQTLEELKNKKKLYKAHYLCECEFCHAKTIVYVDDFDNFFGIQPHEKFEHAWKCPICGHVNIESDKELDNKLYNDELTEIWTVNSDVMNGSVKVFSETAAFATKELAEQVADAIKQANRDKMVLVTIQNTKLYSSADEVPILNKKK